MRGREAATPCALLKPDERLATRPIMSLHSSPCAQYDAYTWGQGSEAALSWQTLAEHWNAGLQHVTVQCDPQHSSLCC